MQWFLHSSLIWAFLLVLAPLLIHLINLMRHRRVKWAAMDFLLQSYKRRRQWIWLKQFLLLASRMAAVALIVAMLAKFQGCSDLASRFGGTTTHHYVLLDDSYSMAERQGRERAFDRAMRVVGQIANQAVAQTGRHKMTLLRFSKAAGAKQAAASAADLEGELIDGRFDLLLEERRNTFEATFLNVGPTQALDLTRRLAARRTDEKAVVYVVTDMRANQWDSPAELRQKLVELQEAGAELRLVNCVERPEANLTAVDLAPQDQTRAAGVPLFVDVKVRNNGDSPARQVQAAVRTRFYPTTGLDRSTPPGQWTPQVEELPTVIFDQIAPGETAAQRVQVYFPQPGRHVVDVELPADALAPDNRRWLVVDLPEGERVLLVDGSPEQGGSYFLSSAFEPGSRANTGIRTETQTPAFLRDAPLETLQQYASVYLLDVPQLDQRAVTTLEKYVQSGGGLGIFLGPNVNTSFYNESLYRDGAGLFPAPLERETLLPPAVSDGTPDFEMADHPIFRPFLRVRNPVVRMVAIERFLKIAGDWELKEDSGVSVVGTLRDVRQPLALDKQFGAGRVITFFTTVGPQWNNWAHNLSFVPIVLGLQSHLASSQRQQPARLTGEPLPITLEADRYAAEVSFVAPSGDERQPAVIEKSAARAQGGSPLMTASLGEAQTVSGETGRPGIYEAWAKRLDGEVEVRRQAVNVDPEEGRLEQTARQTLLERLEPATPRLQDWKDYQSETMARAESNWSEIILYLLIFLLLGEQLLAFSASYHPAPQGAR